MQKEDIQVLYFEDDGRFRITRIFRLLFIKRYLMKKRCRKQSPSSAGTIGRTAGRAEYFRITIFTAPRTKFLSR